MTINDQIRDEKLQYDINREAAKISALSSNKIGKYEYLTGEEILPSIQKQIIEQAYINLLIFRLPSKQKSFRLHSKQKQKSYSSKPSTSSKAINIILSVES